MPPKRKDFLERYDALWALHSGAYLRSLGKEKALAVMLQASRLRGHDRNDPFLWLARLVFEGNFPVPMIGRITPEPPKDRTTWPTYPLRIVDGIPFFFLGGVELGGMAESFEGYAKRASKAWVIRRETPRPPNDPFPSFEKAISMFVGGPHVNRYGYNLAYQDQFRTLQSLICEVFPEKLDPFLLPDNALFAKYHAGFLRVGAHWDDELRRYVRKDGSWTPSDALRYPIVEDKVAVPGP